MLADVAAAGEGNLADAGVGADGVADFAAGAGDALDGVGGHSGFEEDFGELEGGERGVAGGLDNHGVAGGDGGADFVADEVEGEVEGADGGDDAAGDAHGEAELAGDTGCAVEGDGLAVDAFGFLGGAGDGLDGASHLATALGDGLAFFEGDGAAEVFGALFHELGGAAENQVALVAGDAGHFLCALDGGGDGEVDVVGVAAGDGVDGGAVEGVNDGNGTRAVGPLGAYVHLHWGPPDGWRLGSGGMIVKG